MSTRSTILLALALAVCAVAVGCGGDDTGASGGELRGGPLETSSLSKAQFVKRATAACNRLRQGVVSEVNAYAAKHEGKPEDVVIAGAMKSILVPVVEGEITAIRRLGAPAGEKEEVEAILIAKQEGIDEVKQLQQAKSMVVYSEHFKPARERLHAYGITGC